MNNVFITTQIGALRRSNYKSTVNPLQKNADQDVATTESTEQRSAGTLPSQPPTKKRKTQSFVAAFAQPISKQCTLELHALLCEAFVLGNIPYRFTKTQPSKNTNAILLSPSTLFQIGNYNEIKFYHSYTPTSWRICSLV